MLVVVVVVLAVDEQLPGVELLDEEALELLDDDELLLLDGSGTPCGITELSTTTGTFELASVAC